MKQSRKTQTSRYSVSGNVEAQYMDRRKTVLKNKKGIRKIRVLQLLEEEDLAKAYERLLREVRIDTLMTSELLQYIHRCIFGELYEWAGKWRTVKISKPGVTWPPPDFLHQAMDAFDRDILRRYPLSSLKDDHAFCRALAHIQGEFLSIHPFREGNARTIKLFTDLIAAQTDRPPLRYDKTKRGQLCYITAAKRALHKKDYGLLEKIIFIALSAAMKNEVF